MLWYWLVPPPGFVTDTQKTLVHFFWYEKTHWVMAQVLNLLIEEGSQLLVCACTQVHLQTLQQYLYIERPPKWCTLVMYFFLHVRNLNYDTQLLFIDHEGLQVTLRMLPAFYQDLITVWDIVNSCQAYPPSGKAAIVKEPLLRNLHLHNRWFEWLVKGRAMAVG
eukprot:g39033.t1